MSVKHYRILPTQNKSLAVRIKLAGDVLACHVLPPAPFLFQLLLHLSGKVRRASTRSEKAVEEDILQSSLSTVVKVELIV